MFNPFKAAFSAGSKAMGGHDFQSDKVDDYSNGQPILTPFQRARQEWDDRSAPRWSAVGTGVWRSSPPAEPT